MPNQQGDYVQNNFSAGVLLGASATLDDIPQYKRGLADALNVNITTLGSLRVRSQLNSVFGNTVASSSFKVRAYKDTQDNYWIIQFNIQGGKLGVQSVAIQPYGNLPSGQLTFNLTVDNTTTNSIVHHVQQALDTIIFCVDNKVYAVKMREWVVRELTYKQIVRVMEDSVPKTFEVAGAPFGNSSVQATEFYNGRMLFAVGDKIYGSAVDEYLVGDNGNEVVFRRIAKLGEANGLPNKTDPIALEDIGDGLDSDSITTTLTGRKTNRIFDLRVLNGLYAFTDGGVFYSPEQLFTPLNFIMQSVNNVLTKRVFPQEVADSFMFIRQSTGAPEALIDMKQEFQGESYSFAAQDISIFIEGWLQDIKRIVVSKGNEVDTMEIAYLLENDGKTIYCLHINREQSILGWTRWNIEELGVGVVINDLTVIENRLFASASNSFVYELQAGDNASVKWSLKVLLPSFRARGEELNVANWRILKFFIEVRNASTALFINGSELASRYFAQTSDSRNAIFERNIPGISSRRNRSRSLSEGVEISGTGGGQMQIDKITQRVAF